MKICEECGKENQRRKDSKYCSKECHRARNIKNARLRYIKKNIPKPIIQNSCIFCGVLLQRKIYSSGKLEAFTGLRDRKFCNLQCRDEFNKKQHKNKPIPPPNVCVKCGGPVERGGSSKTLCKKCYYIEDKKNKPELWDQVKKRSATRRRERTRIRKGLPLDHPRLIANYGEGHLSRDGYRTVTRKGHPNEKNKRGHIYEHVLIMSEYLGRPLVKGETVHHKNGVRDDNRIENLELWSKNHPPGQRLEDIINWCTEFLIQYGYEIESKLVCNIKPLDITAPSSEIGYIDKKGYKTIFKKNHPNSVGARKSAIGEHRWVMSEYLGRPLKPNEAVHHKNGIRHDNRIENLELWSNSQPPGQRVIDKISFYIDFLSQYGYEARQVINILREPIKDADS